MRRVALSRFGRRQSKRAAASVDSMDDVETETGALTLASSLSTSSSPPTKKSHQSMVTSVGTDDGIPGGSVVVDDADELLGDPPTDDLQELAPSGIAVTAVGAGLAQDASENATMSMPAAPSAPKPKRQIVMIPSVFEGRPPVLFFSYTTACGAKQRSLERAVYADIDGPRIFYSHTDAVHEYNAVINMMRQGGLYRIKVDTQRYLLLWSNHPSPEVLQAMRPSQRTNHFPGSWHLGRKDLLWKNISRVQRRFGRQFTITPQGYTLPKAFLAWDAARLRQPDALWIWKPPSSSCGRGIKVFSSDITPEEAKVFGRKRGVIQRYIPNPLLIEGYKFDLRIYVVVLSYDPLKVYINDEGLVRLATQKYSADPATLESRTMHLTNYSVNKLSPTFVQNKDGRDATIRYRNGAAPPAVLAASEAAGSGNGDDGATVETEASDGSAPPASKWSLTELRSNFEERGLDYECMFNRIKDVVIKTLIAVEPPIRAEWAKALNDEEAGWLARGPSGAHSDSTSTCFEMYGFDVLVDSDLKPWLLEVNICPSLSSGSPLDKRIKTKLVADTLTLVGIRPPANVWRQLRGSVKRPSSDVIGMACDDSENYGMGTALCPGDLAKRAAKLAACDNPLNAIALFDELAWETVLEAHDQDMRCGGLERIFPTSDATRYVQYFEEESYFNIVLRKWYEAGGGKAFFGPQATSADALPPWVPRQCCFLST